MDISHVRLRGHSFIHGLVQRTSSRVLSHDFRRSRVSYSSISTPTVSKILTAYACCSLLSQLSYSPYPPDQHWDEAIAMHPSHLLTPRLFLCVRALEIASPTGPPTWRPAFFHSLYAPSDRPERMRLTAVTRLPARGHGNIRNCTPPRPTDQANPTSAPSFSHPFTRRRPPESFSCRINLPTPGRSPRPMSQAHHARGRRLRGFPCMFLTRSEYLDGLYQLMPR